MQRVILLNHFYASGSERFFIFFLFEHFRYPASAETPRGIQVKTESDRGRPAPPRRGQSHHCVSELALPCPDR